MTKRNQRTGLRGTILPTAIGVAAIGVGTAWAALSVPYNFDGSDTLGDVAPTTITASGATELHYRAMGSGTGEANVLAGTQSIAFMSRNFKATVLSGTGHSGWQPQPNNVLGLDAGVVVVRNWTQKMQNVVMAPDTANPGKALPDSDISLVMSGYQAAGTAAACRHPNRLAAIDRITNAMHTSQINHFYRRNDASGTTDTFRERVLTRAASGGGGRFCNGQAPGGVKTDGVTLYTNMDSDDADPVRRDCVFTAGDTAHKQTKCTFWPANVTCTFGQTSTGVGGIPDGTPCTQGLVIPITDADTGSTDSTTTIAARVAADDSNGTLGFAGREAVRQPGAPTYGPTINKISAADANVRLNQYPLSRRLFLNHGDPITSPAGDPLLADKQAQENTLYDYATGDNGRCNMGPIMKQWGFVPCYQNCNNPGSGYNLCDDSSISAAETTLGLCTAEGKACTAGTTLCCDGSTCAGTTCPLASGQAGSGEACATDLDCVSGKTCQDLGGVSKVCQP